VSIVQRGAIPEADAAERWSVGKRGGSMIVAVPSPRSTRYEE
jgi:hypothetical protein